MKTQSRIRIWGLLALVLMAGGTLAATLAPQTNRAGGVDVKVTPRTLVAGAAAWEFEVVFSTHSVELTGDPAQFARLVDSRGAEHAPLAWQGDPPGGHHRKGVLRFKPLADQSQIELRLSGVGAAVVRNFRWELR